MQSKSPIFVFSVIMITLGANVLALINLDELPNLAFMNEIKALKNIFDPSGPVDSKVTFYLFTRQNKDKPQELKLGDVYLLKSSYFSRHKRTKFLIHGYMDNVNRPMPQTNKNNFLEAEDVNVIVVDWGKIAQGINYFSIAKKTPEVGAFVALMIDWLVTEGLKPKSFHIIGHSLGAHVAGFTGKALTKGKPFRITGLDPAKPMFHNVDPSERLDPSDADFVDCIHTCGGILGLYEPFCHADFYPNGGTERQPGCPLFDFGHCSHVRSYKYFAESILKGHVFPALKCDWRDAPINCNSSEVAMGDNANRRTRGVYYLTTNEDYPFAPIHL